MQERTKQEASHFLISSCILTQRNQLCHWHKHTHKIMEQKWRAQTKLMHAQSTSIWQGSQEYTVEKSSLLNNWCWAKWIFTCIRIKLSTLCYSTPKINLKWIQDVNEWYKTKILSHHFSSYYAKTELLRWWRAGWGVVLEIEACVCETDFLQ